MVSPVSLACCRASPELPGTSGMPPPAGEHLIEVFLLASCLGAPRHYFPNHAGENDEPNLPLVIEVHHDFSATGGRRAGQAGTPAFRDAWWSPFGSPQQFFVLSST